MSKFLLFLLCSVLCGCSTYTYIGISEKDLTYITVTSFASDRALENFHLKTNQTSRELLAGGLTSVQSTGAKTVSSAAGTIAGAAIRAAIAP